MSCEICMHNPPTQLNSTTWVGLVSTHLMRVGNFSTQQAWVDLKKPFNPTHLYPRSNHIRIPQSKNRKIKIENQHKDLWQSGKCLKNFSKKKKTTPGITTIN